MPPPAGVASGWRRSGGPRSDPEAAFAPVAVARRSGRDESVHHGAVVALAADGRVTWAAGDPTVPIYPRSALEAAAGGGDGRAGLALDDRLLAVVCASHDGRPEHVAAVREILAGAGLTDDALDNTPACRSRPTPPRSIVCAGGGRASITQNCSGKHAGMLATCGVQRLADGSGYRQPDHPCSG